MTMHFDHTTVLLNEAVNALLAVKRPITKRPFTFLDGTFGRGGHTKLLLANLSSDDRLLVFDKDPQAIEAAKALADRRLEIFAQPFSAIADLAANSVDGILLDLGVSSPQIDDASRGFSFRFTGPLDMRMNPAIGISVSQWLEQATYQQIKEVIKNYGEERFAAKIAAAIIEYRESKGSIQTTTELAELVAAKVKTREKQHPATRTFQAFRIFINDELAELSKALQASKSVLKEGGCLAVISFHSLEDRLVKQFLQRYSKEQVLRHSPVADASNLLFSGVKRIKASAAEVALNARARSAVMRVAYRTARVCQD